MKTNTKQYLSAFGVVIIATLVGAFATLNLTFLKGFENAASDIRISALQPPEEQSQKIVLATITEETVALFQYRSPVDREFLANLIMLLQAKGAKAIGVDILLDSPTEIEKDKYLKETLRNATVPLFLSYTNSPGVVTEDQLEYLNDFVPEKFRAAANMATDPFDGTVRWIFPGETNVGMPVSFPRKGAEIYGVDTSNLFEKEKKAQTNLPIAWRPKKDLETPAFPEYPAHAVAVLPAAWFKDKIVLVGAKLSLEDRHRTPMAIIDDEWEGRMPGVTVMAHAMSQLIEDRKPHKVTTELTFAICTVLGITGMLIGLAKKGILFSVIGGFFAAFILWLVAFLGFSKGLPMIPVIAPTITLAFALWMMDLLIGKAERQQRQFVQGAFSRYVEPAVVEKLVENPEYLNVTGVKQDTTFIFTDVAGFTTLSEKLESKVLSDVLNAYLDGACEIIFRYGGTVDKFIGDAIMVVFNAPIPQKDHIDRAVKCALELDVYCEKFREEENAKGIPIGVTRIGVHTGPATVGNFGSQSRMDFTALGDTVNTAARTEGVNKYFGTRIAATEEIVTKCGTNLFFLPIGDIVLKGKTVPVPLYNPVSEDFFNSEYAKEYRDVYKELQKTDIEINLKNRNDNELQGHPVGNKMIELHKRFLNEPLAKFHTDRIRKGLITTRVIMDSK